MYLFLQWSKTERVVAHPTARSGTDPLPFPALLPAKVSQLRDICACNCCPRTCPVATTHFSKIQVKPATSLTTAAVGAWKGEATGLLSRSIYYSLNCKNGQTNFPNLGGQPHSQPHCPKPEEMGGTRMTSKTSFSVKRSVQPNNC